MGVDIYVSCGVPVTAKKLANIVTEQNRELVCRTLVRYATSTFHALKEDLNVGELDECGRRRKQSIAKLLLTSFSALSVESTVEDVQQMLVAMAPACEDGVDSRVENSEEAIEIWGELIGVLFPGTPKPESTVCVGSPRYQGCSLPRGEAIFVFGEKECFERVKTDAGRQLDSMLGESTELAIWTEYSC